MTIVVAILFGPLSFGLGLTYAHFLEVVSIDMILSSLLVHLSLSLSSSFVSPVGRVPDNSF